MANPKVTSVEFIQKDLIRLTFDQLIRADKPSFTTLSNYAFTPLNGGTNMVVTSVVPDLNNPEAVTTSTAYIRFKGGTLGGTYSAVFQNLEGISIQSGNVLLNPSFEFGSGQTATGWTYLEFVSGAGSFDFGLGRSKRMDASSYYTNQVGVRSYVLGDFNLLGTVDANIGDFCQVQSNPFDATNVDFITLNYHWLPFIDGGPWYEFEVSVGPDILATHSGTPVDLVDAIYPLPTATGTQTVVFKMTRINFNGLKTVATAFVDNVRVTESVIPVMSASENSFVFNTRTTKVDALKTKFPRLYDLSVGSNLWTIVSAMGLEDTKIGG